MKRTRHLIAAIAATAAVMTTLAACGGGSSDGRPTSADISDSLQNGKAASLVPSGTSISDDAADCMGKALHDSKLSDEALRAFVDGDADYQGSSDDASAVSDLTEDMAGCLGTE
jgi:hypothetical protein